MSDPLRDCGYMVLHPGGTPTRTYKGRTTFTIYGRLADARKRARNAGGTVHLALIGPVVD